MDYNFLRSRVSPPTYKWWSVFLFLWHPGNPDPLLFHLPLTDSGIQTIAPPFLHLSSAPFAPRISNTQVFLMIPKIPVLVIHPEFCPFFKVISSLSFFGFSRKSPVSFQIGFHPEEMFLLPLFPCIIGTLPILLSEFSRSSSNCSPSCVRKIFFFLYFLKDLFRLILLL